jgi:hypothetical protein
MSGSYYNPPGGFMSTVEQMLDAYPADLGGVDKARLAACIDACVDCAQTCTA